jgi:hypothetical protein
MSFLDLDKFVHIEGGRHLSNGGFTRNEWMHITEIPEYRQRNGNIGIYTTAYVYDSQDIKEANLYGDLYFDFDDEDNFENVRRDVRSLITYAKSTMFLGIPEKLIRLYFSGKKGIHLILPAIIFGVIPNKFLNQYYKQMATEIKDYASMITLDLKIYDNRRLFRLPNSQHQDTKLYKIGLTVDEVLNLPYQEIRQLAEQPRKMTWGSPYEIPRAKSAYHTSIDNWKNKWEDKFGKDRRFGTGKLFEKDPHCIQEMLDMGPKKGQRNNTAAALVSYYKGQNKTEQEVWDFILAWNKGSLTENELKLVVKSVFSGQYSYGCTTFESLSSCSKECEIYKYRLDK